MLSEFGEAADEISKENKDQFIFFGKVDVTKETKLINRFKVHDTPFISWFV